jgi:hypothetical protein
MPLRKEMVHKPKYCQRVESDSEKIALNCLLLLIVTGFRSVEIFILGMMHWPNVRLTIQRSLRKRFRDRGLPDYFLGIHYVSVKGAGERTHWQFHWLRVFSAQ